MEYISIITFFAGFIISEIIRRFNRAETFNIQVFNKRLEVYCGLYSKWTKTYNKMTEFVQNIEGHNDIETLNKKHYQISLLLLNYLDDNALFISEELSVHCCAALLGFDDFSKDDCENYLNELQTQNKIVTEMIKNESGLNMLNKNIRSIVKYKHKSEIISYYTQKKKETLQK